MAYYYISIKPEILENHKTKNSFFVKKNINKYRNKLKYEKNFWYDF